MLPRVVAILGFDGVSALDVTGPLEALGALTWWRTIERRVLISPVIVGLKGKEFLAESGLTLKATVTIKRNSIVDTDNHSRWQRAGEAGSKSSSFVVDNKPGRKTRRIASISTGIYALARTGLLDGRQVTTHWRVSHDVARRFRDYASITLRTFSRTTSFTLPPVPVWRGNDSRLNLGRLWLSGCQSGGAPNTAFTPNRLDPRLS